MIKATLLSDVLEGSTARVFVLYGADELGGSWLLREYANASGAQWLDFFDGEPSLAFLVDDFVRHFGIDAASGHPEEVFLLLVAHLRRCGGTCVARVGNVSFDPAVREYLARLIRFTLREVRWVLSASSVDILGLLPAVPMETIEEIPASHLLVDERRCTQLLGEFGFPQPERLAPRVLSWSGGWLVALRALERLSDQVDIEDTLRCAQEQAFHFFSAHSFAALSERDRLILLGVAPFDMINEARLRLLDVPDATVWLRDMQTRGFLVSEGGRLRLSAFVRSFLLDQLAHRLDGPQILERAAVIAKTTGMVNESQLLFACAGSDEGMRLFYGGWDVLDNGFLDDFVLHPARKDAIGFEEELAHVVVSSRRAVDAEVVAKLAACEVREDCNSAQLARWGVETLVHSRQPQAAIELYRRAGLEDPRAAAFAAVACGYLGDPESGLHILRRIHPKNAQAVYHAASALLFAHQNNPVMASEQLRLAEMAPDLTTAMRPWVRLIAGECALDEDLVDVASECFEEALHAFTQSGDRVARAIVARRYAWIVLEAGDVIRAARLLSMDEAAIAPELQAFLHVIRGDVDVAFDLLSSVSTAGELGSYRRGFIAMLAALVGDEARTVELLDTFDAALASAPATSRWSAYGLLFASFAAWCCGHRSRMAHYERIVHGLGHSARFKAIWGVLDHYRQDRSGEDVDLGILTVTGAGFFRWALDHTEGPLYLRLTPRCRQVYRLYVDEGLEVPEISERLELSRATVKSHFATICRTVGLEHYTDLRRRRQRQEFIA